MSESKSYVVKKKFGFFSILKDAFSAFFSKFFYVLCLGLIVVVVDAGELYLASNLELLSFVLEMPGAVIISSGVLLAVLIFFFTVFIGLMYQSIAKSHFNKSKVSFSSHFSYAFSNLMKGAGVQWRVFWYVAKWFVPVVLIMIASYVMASYSSSLFDPLDPSSFDMENAQAMASYLNILNSASMVFMLTAGVMAINRFPKVLFALPAFVEDGISGNDALLTSQKLAKGKWWLVFGYIFLMALVSSLIFLAFTYLVELVFPVSDLFNNFSLLLAVQSLSALIGVFVSAISANFGYKFYLNLKK